MKTHAFRLRVCPPSRVPGQTATPLNASIQVCADCGCRVTRSVSGPWLYSASDDAGDPKAGGWAIEPPPCLPPPGPGPATLAAAEARRAAGVVGAWPVRMTPDADDDFMQPDSLPDCKDGVHQPWCRHASKSTPEKDDGR